MARSPRTYWRRLRRWRRRLEFTLARKFGLSTTEDRAFFLAVGLTGVVAGCLGVAIHRLIALVERLLWGPGESIVLRAAQVSDTRVLVATSIGGVLIGLLVLWHGKRVPGPGMSILVESVALRGGRVPVRPILWSSVAGVITVGSGGALGREGPMIRLGAMLSSRLGVWLRLPPHRLKVLVGCGAAGGLAAAYNIPIGGALFAMEVILGNFALQIFGPIVVASVVSTLIARAVEGDSHLIATPPYELVSGWEVLTYVGLGLLAAVASMLFVFTVRRLGGLLERLPLPDFLRPVLGFPLLGLLAIQVPWVMGGGQDGLNALFSDQLLPVEDLDALADPGSLALLLLGLALAKILATALTAGSGGVGGMFSPSLFFGAFIGGAYGVLVHAAWPEVSAPFGAYAVVGMAATAAGTSHAPISAILILFEITGNYDLVLPLMIASIVSSLLSSRLYPASVYNEPLHREGLDPNMRLEQAVLAGMTVADLTRDDPEILSPADGFRRVLDHFFDRPRSRLFVVDDDGRLLGEVSLHDIKHVLDQPGLLPVVLAHDLMRPPERTVGVDERLHEAAETLARSDHERLPVVDAEGRFRGVLTKRDLLAVYAQEVLGRPAMLATFVADRGHGGESRDYVELPPDFALRLVDLPRRWAGHTLGALRLPQRKGIQVIEIKRGEERVMPAGETVLDEKDQLIVLGPTDAIEALEAGEVEAPEEETPEDPPDQGTRP